MINRLLPVFLLLLSICSCKAAKRNIADTLESFFDLPDRSLQRSIVDEELYGNWELTDGSRERLRSQMDDDFWKDMSLPLLYFRLEPQGHIYSSWEQGAGKLLFRFSEELPDPFLGQWELKQDVVNIRFLSPQGEKYGYYEIELMISESQGELVLWLYMQDPDQLLYQEYKKTALAE
jgi:hypothetical protein